MKALRGRSSIALTIGLLIIAIIPASAGPVDPPPGPVAATGATMIFDPPGSASYTIISPGSYKLAGDLVDSPLVIAADNVLVDLHGFAIRRATVSGTMVSAGTNVTIRNGIVRGGRVGISAGNGLKLENMVITAVGNDVSTDYGVIAGSDCSMVNCEVSVTGAGVVLGVRANVTNCRVFNSGYNGLTVGNNSVVSRCIAFSNGNSINPPYTGQITAGDYCVVTDSSCTGLGGVSTRAMVVGQGTTVGRCSLYGSIDALVAGDKCVISDSTLEIGSIGASPGADVGASSRVSNCTIRGGIGLGVGSTMDGCSITTGTTSSQSTAVTLASESIVRNCSIVVASTSPAALGVAIAGSRNCVEGNRISGGVTGISLDGSRNRVHDNALTSTGTGVSIAATSTNNVITANVLSEVPTPVSNLNPGANAVAQIINRAGSNAFVSTDPMANITY